MKKILFICPRNPFSGRYSGDVIRAKKFIYSLSRSNYVKIISPDLRDIKKNESKFSYEGFGDTNLFLKSFYILFSFIKLQPLQLGYFYSPPIVEYVKKNHKKYDFIFYQSFRSAQYIPKDSVKKNILDMGDLYSKNYEQTYKKLFFFNPIKIVYFIESLLLKKYEKYCFNSFDKILLFSKKEINTIEKKYKKKLVQINFGIDQVKKKYKFHKNNYKIVFIGNIKYAPNRKACFEFAKNIMPKILKFYSNIEFHIIGEISKIDKFILGKKTNVRILDKVDNLEPHLDKTICGLANLDISTGIQTKLLTYMSYGIPSVCSKQVSENFDAIKNTKINFYKNDSEMIRLIIKLKENKNYALNSSKRALKNIVKFRWDKVLLTFNKVFK